MKIVNFYIALDTIYFYIFKMLQVNEMAVISPEWKTTGSLPDYLPTEAATGSRPNKMYYIEANPYYFVNITNFCWRARGLSLYLYYYYSFPRCH
jgi:hypothetical protein